MTCSINYLQNSPFKEEAEKVHNQIKNDLLKLPVEQIVIKDVTYIKKKESFRLKSLDSLVEKYGEVFIQDSNFIGVNALKSKQYLNYVVDNRILEVKDYTELKPSELINLCILH